MYKPSFKWHKSIEICEAPWKNQAELGTDSAIVRHIQKTNGVIFLEFFNLLILSTFDVYYPYFKKLL